MPKKPFCFHLHKKDAVVMKKNCRIVVHGMEDETIKFVERPRMDKCQQYVE